MYELDKPIWFVIGFFLGFPLGLMLPIVLWHLPIIPLLNAIFGEVVISDIKDVTVWGLRNVFAALVLICPIGIVLSRIKKESIYLLLGILITSSITVFIITSIIAIIGAIAVSSDL